MALLCFNLLGDNGLVMIWPRLLDTLLGGAIAVATAIAVMQVTLTVHPPGGATALIAVLGPTRIHELGYRYVVTPVLPAVLLMILVALLVNNLSPEEHHHYPVTWR